MGSMARSTGLNTAYESVRDLARRWAPAVGGSASLEDRVAFFEEGGDALHVVLAVKAS